MKDMLKTIIFVITCVTLSASIVLCHRAYSNMAEANRNLAEFEHQLKEMQELRREELQLQIQSKENADRNATIECLIVTNEFLSDLTMFNLCVQKEIKARGLPKTDHIFRSLEEWEEFKNELK